MLEENCFKLFWKSTRLIGFMVVLFALLLLSACTDYLQDIDDKYDEWLARTESAAKSSSSVTKSSSSVIMRGIQKDSRDGQTYKTVVIGSQTWMAQNLNYKMENSYCYNDSISNCTKYGRLYTWIAAQEACPIGWRLPSKAEFETLFTTVGGQSTAGEMLKSTSGWYNSGDGSDVYLFSALPAGNWDKSKGIFVNSERHAFFWSSTEYDYSSAYNMRLSSGATDAKLDLNPKNLGYSIRCVKDELEGMSSSEKNKSSSSALVLSSSISAKTSSSINASSSSVKGSSSSKKTISSSSSAKFSSSSKKLEYSSSSAAPSNTGGGTCAPASPIVEQDEVVIWKYTVGGSVKTTDMLSANLKWSTPGATPESLDGKGAKFMSDTVKYATSGQHTATLSLSTAKGSFNLNCAPVQVNGTKITGCKCETAAKSVDFKTTPGVEWGVSGCSTGADLVLSYEWDGAPGAASFTKTFTAATDAYAPKLYVKNNDNTMIEVTCPSVKITDGPEFEITTTQGAGAIKLPKGTSDVFLNVDALHNTVFCNVSRDDSPSGALNGTVNKTAIKGSDYIAVSMPAGMLVKGAMLEFTLSVPATCGVQ